MAASLVALLAGCASAPDVKPYVTRPSSSRSSVVNYALSLQGAPYRYGKASPEEGFDCSGFVQHVYKHHGVMLPRRARDMAEQLPAITQNQLTPGDLLFFNTNGGAFSHVGIFIQEDRFIHAPSQRTGRVLISSLTNKYWQKHYTGARRP